MDYMVTHIRRDGADLDRRIDMLKGPSFGPSWIDAIISDIIAGNNRYYVPLGPSLVDPIAYLEVKWSVANRPYLRTIPDGLYDNNLYSLPEI